MSRYKKNKAVALKYNVDEDDAPVVIASGYGTIAEKIIDIAEQKGIPVFRDDSAASLMCMLEVGSSIPVELYEVVAAIYCQLLKTSAEIKGQSADRPSNHAFFAERRNRFVERRMASQNGLELDEDNEAVEKKQESAKEERGEKEV